MADGCENVTASCAATFSPSWSIRRFHRITMAARGNCGPQPHTAKSRVASVPSGEPICSLAFDPSLEQQRDEEGCVSGYSRSPTRGICHSAGLSRYKIWGSYNGGKHSYLPSKPMDCCLPEV